MDILTPKGQETLAHEAEAIALFERDYHFHRFLHTAKHKPLAFDGMVLEGDDLQAIVEIKCRNMTEKQFRNTHQAEWLVTHDKILRCAAAAKIIGVPLSGWLYLVPDKVLLMRRLADAEGNIVDMRLDRTTTQATVNGGSATRVNAYIDMSKAKRIV
jgi:hypothetical protein